MENDFTKYLEVSSNLLSKKIHKKLEEFSIKIAFDTDDLTALEYDILKDFINVYSKLFEGKSVDEYIDIVLKISLDNSSIGVFPNNLFTALLTSNRYRNDMDPEILEEENCYNIEDGLIASFNYDDKVLIKKKLH